jgi:hypothetical protein
MLAASNQENATAAVPLLQQAVAELRVSSKSLQQPSSSVGGNSEDEKKLRIEKKELQLNLGFELCVTATKLGFAQRDQQQQHMQQLEKERDGVVVVLDDEFQQQEKTGEARRFKICTFV